MKTSIRKMGNSHGVIIPKPWLADIGLEANDPIDMKVKKGRIVISPLHRGPRTGWAEDSKRLHEAGETGLVWPQPATNSDEDPDGRAR